MLGRRQRAPTDRPRRGVILLVVLALLALFAVVGLSFVLYANATAAAARLHLEAETLKPPDVEPEVLAAYFLQKFLFDERDDQAGVYSALRGHSLLRTMYGTNYDFNANGTLDLLNNTVAYNGNGRLHAPTPFAAVPTAPPQAKDDYFLANYTYFPADGFLRDPERPGTRAGLAAPRQPFLAGCNAPYTYPDLNTLFLAAVKADGTVLVPSFHRPWAGFGALDPANPNWTDTTQPWLKYMVLRPRPADHPVVNGKPGFPPPADAGGDVKNLIGAPGGNDSIWLDLNFPVLAMPDGRKYKPLFAPLITDLDGKVNVNVHGNVRGQGHDHVSNQGWGSWEVALGPVLGADPWEWQNLLLGVTSPDGNLEAIGRYGTDLQPTPNPPVTTAAFGPTPHFYARVDLDGSRRDGGATLPLQLPTGTSCFPTFPAGYDNADLAERTNHPSLYRVLGPPGRNGASFDRRFALSNMEALLRYHDTGWPALTSELLRLCPENFADPRIRRLVTTHSADLDRAGVAPWVWGNTPYGTTVRDSHYPDTPERLGGGGAKPFPDISVTNPLYNEFGPDGRAVDAALSRVDLNRLLPNYPAPDPLTGVITDPAGFQTAQAARQNLAREIFLRLAKVAGAYDPTTYLSSTAPSNPSPPGQAELDTLRWLAQFAVNLVDYIDADDFITPFNWGQATGTPAFAALFGGQWVFGTELPHVLVNEAYAEYVNVPGETGPKKRATKFDVNLWVELLNPFVTDPTLWNGGDAVLDGAYQLVVTRPNRALLSARDTANVLGDPDGTGPNQTYNPAQVSAVLARFTPAAVPTADKPGQGFYVLGPASPVPGEQAWDPGPQFGTLRRPELTYQVPVRPGQVAPPLPPTLLLRRLACPFLPWQPDPTQDSPAKPYNPYVTVDYLESVPLNYGITNDGTGFINHPTPVTQRASVGRRQPYNGSPRAILSQVPAVPAPGQARHTFFSHNTLPESPFDWLVHLDRPPVSPLELVHVSCCKPHQLTHLFKDTRSDAYQSFNHAPYWLLRDETSPLYRVFEFLETHTRAGGVVPGGRLPGKINLNTIWDREVFDALCDPQPANYFTAADVRQIYDWMLAGRTPGGTPGPNDRPFKSLGGAHFAPTGDTYAEGNGLNDTLLRANPSHPLYDAAVRPVRLFEVVQKPPKNGILQDHPYQRYELLNKVFNQVTTRSNVFAVWVTVGFFEVNDDTTQPVKLGAELGRAENRHVRHRLFAIVDRSTLFPLFPGGQLPPITSPTPVLGPGPAVVAPTLMGDPNPKATNGIYTWRIQKGMLLRVTGPDGNGGSAAEDVVVTDVADTTFTATFSRAYPRGFTSISAYGNPGPRPLFLPRDAAPLVPYFSIIN